MSPKKSTSADSHVGGRDSAEMTSILRRRKSFENVNHVPLKWRLSARNPQLLNFHVVKIDY
jgi:hypothetical protein